MLLEKFHGKFDMRGEDNNVTNMVFFAGLVVTLVIVVGLLMYAFL
jgi:hypothetical protein